MKEEDWCHTRAAQEERAEVLWRSLERVIPDIRRRAEVVQIGARRAPRGAGGACMRPSYPLRAWVWERT